MDVSRYNFTCQKALHQGLQYARSFGHQFLEVEHIALALLRAQSINLQGNEETLSNLLQDYLTGTPKVFGNITVEFGPRLNSALDAVEKSQKDQPIEEILLWESLSKESTIIKNFLLNPTKSSTREDVSNLAHNDANLTGKSSKKKEIKEKNASYNISKELEKVLNDFTIDLTAMAERGELDPVIGRDNETRRVLEILGRKKKNNPVLTGEPGVGKTAVAECLAIRIVEGRVPESIQGKRLLSLDLGGLIAGAKFRGEFEERMKNLLKAVQACGGEIILFIDEIHMIVGAGSAEGSADAANLLKPALARGEIRCLGATTISEYSKYIEKDPALERRFQPVFVEEPSRDTTLSILRGIKSHYEIYHGVQINDEALVSTVDLSIQFLPGRKLPDKAIDTLDEACSKLRLQIDSVPTAIDKLRSEIDQLEIEKNAIKTDNTAVKALTQIEEKLKEIQKQYDETKGIWKSHQLLLEQLRKLESENQQLKTLFDTSKAQGNFDFAAKLQYQELPKIETSLSKTKLELSSLQTNYSWLRQVVGSLEVGDVIAQKTKIPLDKILRDEMSDLETMEERLKKRVFGQEQAINKVSRAVKRSRVGVNDPKRPLGVFLFLGPTGVGKTEMVKALAAEIFNDENRMIRIDMSEFMEQHNLARLIGAPPGYVGFGEGGELTDGVSRTPYSVVLFDEIEKAHPKILDILLQVFDDGRLTDGKGKLVSFKNTLLIMTSNIAVGEINAANGLEFDEKVRQELTKKLRPEFIGRIDEVVLFNDLGKQHFENLIDKLLQDLNARLSKRELRVLLGEKIRQQILDAGLSTKFGGRALRRIFQRHVVDTVSDKIIENPIKIKGSWKLEVEKEGVFSWNPDSSLHQYLGPAPKKAS